VDVVSHGNHEEWIVAPFHARRNARTPHLTRDAVAEHATDERWLPPPDSSQLDERSRVVLRGCVIGNNQELMDEIRSVFGGAATLLAPRYLQLYDSHTQPPREGFWEQFFLAVAARELPPPAVLAERFAAEFPGRLSEEEAARLLSEMHQSVTRSAPSASTGRICPTGRAPRMPKRSSSGSSRAARSSRGRVRSK
jgi:hypothetical protein